MNHYAEQAEKALIKSTEGDLTLAHVDALTGIGYALLAIREELAEARYCLDDVAAAGADIADTLTVAAEPALRRSWPARLRDRIHRHEGGHDA